MMKKRMDLLFFPSLLIFHFLQTFDSVHDSHMKDSIFILSTEFPFCHNFISLSALKTP